MKIDQLIFCGFNRRVAALYRSSGRIVWQWKAPKGSSYTTLLPEDDLLIVSVDGYMFGLNPLRSQQVWMNEMTGVGTGVTSLASTRGGHSVSHLVAAAANTAEQQRTTARNNRFSIQSRFLMWSGQWHLKCRSPVYLHPSFH